jgi:hypothetical protein
MTRRLLRACWCAALLAPLGLAARGSAKPPDLPLEPQNDVRPQLLDPDAAGNEDAAAAAGFLPPLNQPRPADATPVMPLHIAAGQIALDANQFGQPALGPADTVFDEMCGPPAPRGELLPVPSLYRLRPSVRRQVMESLLFSAHPLMVLMPTDKLLDCPSDHPQTADSSKPACGAACPGLCPRPAERHAYQFTAPDLTQDLLHNLEKLQAAHRLMHLAEHLALSGRVVEALDCFDIVCRLCPGRFEGHVAEIMAQVFSPVYSGSAEDAEDGACEELAAPKEEPEAKATDKEREIEGRLQTKVSVHFTDMPLREVIDDIRAWNGINIYIDEPALIEEGIRLDHPISVKLENVALKSALNLILRNAHLTYVIKDEVLQITTATQACGKLMAVVYPVADLVRHAHGKAKKSEAVTLIQLICRTVAPQSWSEMGGTGTIDYHAASRSLVVNHTPEVQDQVADLLAALRRFMEKKATPEDDAACPSACPKCERLHPARAKGVHEQVEGLMRACRLAAEAGRHAKAAELAREAYALDAERVLADPLVYKMHLLALQRDKGKARHCRPDRAAEPCEPSCPRTGGCPMPMHEPALPPVDDGVVGALERVLEEAEARSDETPRHTGVSLHGRYFDLDCSWTGLRMGGQVPLRGSLYHLQFWNGALSGWVTPNPAYLTSERRWCD